MLIIRQVTSKGVSPSLLVAVFDAPASTRTWNAIVEFRYVAVDSPLPFLGFQNVRLGEVEFLHRGWPHWYLLLFQATATCNHVNKRTEANRHAPSLLQGFYCRRQLREVASIRGRWRHQVSLRAWGVSDNRQFPSTRRRSEHAIDLDFPDVCLNRDPMQNSVSIVAGKVDVRSVLKEDLTVNSFCQSGKEANTQPTSTTSMSA